MPASAAAAIVASLSTATVTRTSSPSAVEGLEAAGVDDLVGDEQVLAEPGGGHARPPPGAWRT